MLLLKIQTTRMISGPVTNQGFHNIIMNTNTEQTRQEALDSAAKQLRKRSNGVTAFDHKWFLFHQHIRLNHWALIAVDFNSTLD